jgi:predicted RNA-binding Zn ribbon-like protein
MNASPPRPISAVRLDGGRLSIDFANSIHDRFAAPAEDYLATPERYVEWARRTGALSPDEHIGLPHGHEATARLMDDIRTLRDTAFQVLAAHIDGAPLPVGALRTLNEWLLEARTDQKVTSDGQLLLRSKPGDARLPLKRVALDLVEVLADSSAGKFKLKHCDNQSSCGWIFADTSKNGRRRWCSMQTCGVAHKMAALRRRSSAPAPNLEPGR